MADVAATVAFGLLIGGQFLGAIYLSSNRSTLYPDQLFRRRVAQFKVRRSMEGRTNGSVDPQRQKRLPEYIKLA